MRRRDLLIGGLLGLSGGKLFAQAWQPGNVSEALAHEYGRTMDAAAGRSGAVLIFQVGGTPDSRICQENGWHYQWVPVGATILKFGTAYTYPTAGTFRYQSNGVQWTNGVMMSPPAAVAYRSNIYRLPGPTWNWPGNLRRHLIIVHRVNIDRDLGNRELVTVHDNLHNHGRIS